VPPIRFRLQTILIGIAALAGVMGAITTLRYPFFDHMIAFTAAVVVLVGAAVGALVLVVVSTVRVIVNLVAYAVDFLRARTRLTQFSSTANWPITRLKPDRSVGPERV
jgi:hypothetical protein